MKKLITLDIMEHDTSIFKTPYAEMNKDDYKLTTPSGYTLKITKFFGNAPYGITLYSPSGASGAIQGYYSAQDALDDFLRILEEGAIREDIKPWQFLLDIARMQK